MMIRLLWCTALVVFLPLATQAATFVAQPDVFTPDVLSTPVDSETYYGELSGWPHTFTFAVATSTPTQYTLAVPEGGTPVSLLLVRQEARGVSEVARVTGTTATWQSATDERFAVTRDVSPAVALELAPGQYRLEVSNPENSGQYELQIGADSQGGYWRTLRDSFAVHAFYGSWYTALLMWQWLVFFGLVLLIFVGVRWRQQSHD